MQAITPDQFGADLRDSIKKDESLVMEKLPGELKKSLDKTNRAGKWLNRFSGELSDSIEVEAQGKNINILSDPIARAYDISGGWAESGLKQFVLQRRAEGYYSRYMKAYRNGEMQKGKITGKKCIPLMYSTISQVGKMIRKIVQENEK